MSTLIQLFQGAAQGSNKLEARNQAMMSGHDVAVQYRELLQIVMLSLVRPSNDAHNQVPYP